MEFHHEPLTEPYLILSHPTARTIEEGTQPSIALSGSSRCRLAQRNFDGLPPSLQSDYRTFITTMRQSDPNRRIGTFGLGLVALCLFP